jgi:hypothetical protein
MMGEEETHHSCRRASPRQSEREDGGTLALTSRSSSFRRSRKVTVRQTPWRKKYLSGPFPAPVCGGSPLRQPIFPTGWSPLL